MPILSIDRNTDESPFFRLSPELRNRVYGLLLGGYDIYVYRPYCMGGYYIDCVAVESETTWTEALSAETTAPQDHMETRKLYDPYAISDLDRSSLRLDLSLLRVSKQIHQEAALLPFTLNTFVVSEWSSLGGFANRLLMAQKLAILKIELHSRVRHFQISKRERASITKLRGLRCFSYVIDESDFDIFSYDTAIADLRQSLKLAKGLFSSRSLIAVSISVRAFADKWRNVAHTEVAIPKEHQDMARETERTIVESQVKVEWKEK